MTALAARFPTLHIVADSIPRAHYRALKAVWEQGLAIRTEYDRKEGGQFIDPPSRDARVLVEITDPFTQPRYPASSFCEIGAYIAEILGAKDHFVLPMQKLLEGKGGHLSATEWPYTYHERLFAHPDINGKRTDQMALAVERVAATPHTRRAIATTSVPDVDPFLKEDVPCLREVQLRCAEDADGSLVLNMNTSWRSRDLYKAWADNIIAITFLGQMLAKEIALKAGRPCRMGSYADYSMSLHIYGQDFARVGGNKEKSIKSFFDAGEDAYVHRSMKSADAQEMLVLPQLKNLLSERGRADWKFPPEGIKLIEGLIRALEGGTLVA